MGSKTSPSEKPPGSELRPGRAAERTTRHATIQRGGWAAALVMLWAQPALAQDASILFLALAPPVFLAPLVLTIGRHAFLRGISRKPIQVLPMFAVSCVEILLWLVAVASATTLATGDSRLWAAAPLVVAVGLNWMLSRVWLDPTQRAARWLYFLSPLLVLVLLAAVTWVVLVNLG